MPEARIPLGPDQKSGWSDLAGGSAVAMNVNVDGLGAVNRRPALASSNWAPVGVIDSTGITGLHLCANGLLFAVGGGPTHKKVYRVLPTIAADLTATGTQLQGTGRPVIAETEAMIVLAAGGLVQRVKYATLVSERLPGNPPNATHVIAQNDRLLVNNTTGTRNQINFSDFAAGSSTAGHETWSGSLSAGFFSADARPDPVVALTENLNEVQAFGSTSVQVFSNDPITNYAPVSAAEYGCSAPYSVVKVDGTFYFLDHKRRFVMSDGRQSQTISDPIQRDLHNMASVSDCFGYRVVHGSCDAVVWTFPADGRTYAFTVGGGWSQWSAWDTASNNWGVFPVTAHYQREDTSENLVGTSNGRIAKLVDGDDDLGTPVHAYVQTGFIDRETSAKKLCKGMKLSMRRGQTMGPEPLMAVSWRDDLGAWEPTVTVSLGVSGDTEPVIPLFGLGVYRKRQWRFDFTAAAGFELTSVMEDFEVLES